MTIEWRKKNRDRLLLAAKERYLAAKKSMGVRPRRGTKICVRCKKRKSVLGFTVDPRSSDKLQSACNKCKYLSQAKYRKDNADKLRKMFREHGRKRRAGDRETSRRRGRVYYRKNAIMFKEASLRCRQRYPERIKAGSAVNAAVRLGKLKKPKKCQVCGKKGKVVGHHKSYRKKDWLKVVWLCEVCHRRVHSRYAKEEGWTC
jgi:hypothetical protein